MSRTTKALLAIGAAILVVAVVVFVAVPLMVPTGAVTAQVASAVKRATGRDLTIKGGVSVSLFPQPGVSAKEVSFSNAAWAGPQPMASLAALDVRLKLRPLLSGAVVIDRIILERPVINLETDKEGRGNWVFTPSSPAAPAEAEGKPASKEGGVPPVAISDIGITHGRLVYTNRSTGRSETLDEVNLTASLPRAAAPLTASGSVRWRDHTLDFSLRADDAEKLAQGNGSPVQVKLSSDVLSAGFDGAASLGRAAEGDGQLDLNVPSVRVLIGWIGGPAVVLPAGGLGPMALKSHLVLQGERVALNDLQLSLDGMKAAGALALTSGTRPKLAGKLAIDRLDANPYLSPPRTAAAPPRAAGAAPAQPSQWSDQPIDTAPLRAADADLTLSAGSAAYRKLEIGQTSLVMHLDNGRFAGDLQQMALYQGQIHGRVDIDASSPDLAAKTDLTLAGVQAEPLLAALAGIDSLAGTASGQTTLASRGRTERQLISGLAGAGRLSFAGGAIKGVDLWSMVSNPTGALAGSQPDKKTEFGQMSGSYTIANGILKNDDLSLVSPLFRLSGAGTVNLPERSLDYRLVPQLGGGQTAGQAAAGISVPLLVRGPWDKLAYMPDLSGIAGKKLGGATKLLEKMMGGKSGAAPSQPSAPSPSQPSPLPIPIPIPGLGR